MKTHPAIPQSPKILVIEDDEDIQELLQTLLLKNGFDVDLAGNGLLALEVLKGTKPDLILLDLAMPGMDGLDFLRLKNEHGSASHIPVVVLSARDGNDDVMKAVDLGAVHYITKPFDNANLLARISGLMSNSKSKGLGQAK